MMCHSIGRPPISTMGLGLEWVSSERRVPYPPAKITTFTSVHVSYERQPYWKMDVRSWCDDGMPCGGPMRQHRSLEPIHLTSVKLFTAVKQPYLGANEMSGASTIVMLRSWDSSDGPPPCSARALVR